MSGATMWKRGASVTNALGAISDHMKLRNEIGKAEDSRLAQPARIIWVPVEDTRRTRECTANHYADADIEVYFERSNEYDVHLRGIDVAACEELETGIVAALVDLGLWSAVELSNGTLASSDNTAAEHGALIRWRVRLWTPVVHATIQTATIMDVDVGVLTVDSDGTTTGAVP